MPIGIHYLLLDGAKLYYADDCRQRDHLSWEESHFKPTQREQLAIDEEETTDYKYGRAMTTAGQHLSKKDSMDYIRRSSLGL